jgi:ISXO2-like transposase domain
VLSLKQYQTAWTWLHKLRSAIVRPGPDLLAGRVEVDECFLGSEEEGSRGRLVQSKALIVVAAEEDGRRIGRIRLRLIPDASAENLHRFILDSIALGNVVHTDGWRAIPA